VLDERVKRKRAIFEYYKSALEGWLGLSLCRSLIGAGRIGG